MATIEHPTIGIEEEYLLVDLASRDLRADPPDAFMGGCRELLGDRVTPELLRCQIEVGTPVCRTVAEARGELARYRRTIAAEAGRHGMGLVAASTHPFADWSDQVTTDKVRYTQLAADLRTVVQRQLICGMHVHVAVPDEEVRIDLHGQFVYFLPHLLALSTSSPFWRGRSTGLKSYRTAISVELPRAGLPQTFASAAEYRRFVDLLVRTGRIEDASKIWWDLRPSQNFPTLELRITDVCTRLDDGITIAALYQSTVQMLLSLRRRNQRWRYYMNALVAENRWLAQRHGISGELLDFGRGEAVPFRDLVEEMIALIGSEADALGCRAEVERARTIAAEGTSADRQLAVFRAATAAGRSEEAALRDVVDHLIAETLEGCGDT
ncbi:MAG TPA: carboxylate-amine ligase [Propylenella sp.]|nr:carboxylate-amine ligase [Propylenella sp.]